MNIGTTFVRWRLSVRDTLVLCQNG